VSDVIPVVSADHADVLLGAAEVEVFVCHFVGAFGIGLCGSVVFEEESDAFQFFFAIVKVVGIVAATWIFLECGPFSNALLDVPSGLFHGDGAHGFSICVQHVNIVVHARFHRDYFHLGLSFPLFLNLTLDVRGQILFGYAELFIKVGFIVVGGCWIVRRSAIIIIVIIISSSSSAASLDYEN